MRSRRMFGSRWAVHRCASRTMPAPRGRSAAALTSTLMCAQPLPPRADKQDFESWNNLANALIKTGHKPRAFLALKEAVRAEYENWKVRCTAGGA